MAAKSAPLLFCLISTAAAAQLPPAVQRPVDFAKDVQPLLRARCYACHGPKVQMSGMRFDKKASAQRAFKPGVSADSLLIQRVAATTGKPQMPPTGPKLSDAEIGLLRAWIDQGAAWPATADGPPHWAFQPIRNPQPPTVSNPAWINNPVDAFILARLDREHITPSPEASKTRLLRRLSLDLIGLPPTPQEIDAFLADSQPGPYQRQVDRLLASPHFGEKWARHWLDLARFADSDGYEKDWFRPWAWRYRDWVIDAFNRDMPFDQFTIEQVAGDLLPNATPQQRIATGFHRNTLTNREGGVDNNQFRFENTVDRASTVSTVWLGLTAGCAQCHDHKFDPISQRDFYQLFAFFDNAEEIDIDAPKPGEHTSPEYLVKRQELLAQYNVPALQAAWEQRLHETIASPGKWLDWDLAWDCVQKLTEGGDGAKILQKPADQRTPREQTILTDHFIRNYHFAVGPKVYKEVKFKELDEKLTALKAAYPQLSQAMTIAESSQPAPTHLRLRGDYKSLGPEVQPAALSVLPPMKTKAPATRLDLARWLVSADNPLTARVAVNRVWQELFGQGLVKSSDDFGTRGDAPSHPELLDWLASDFRDHGWSYKSLIRTMVTSSTYRQDSKQRPELEDKDPSNTLLARQSRLRLSAELIRDSTLSVSSLIDLDIGGKSIRPPQPAGVTELGYGKKVGAGWEETKGPERYRRGLYVQFQRSTPYPELVNFDAPKSNVPVCLRERSNTSLQALNLLNDPVFVEAAGALAKRIEAESKGNFPERLNYAFRLTLGREPTEAESQALRKYWERRQSWAGLSSILLNLDEFITRE